jgi:hypothetical protein
MTVIDLGEPFVHGQQVVLYELNEVPWRVIDWYISQRPNSAISHLLMQSKTYTTLTFDEGELHPWTTWPTLHRGVNNSKHKIHFINQSRGISDETYPPIWETLRRHGFRVGVFGSLQSYPPRNDIGYEFYVPDTFSPSEKTWPSKYQEFQRFNLRQTRQDGAQPGNILLNLDLFKEFFKMLRTGLRAKTLALLVLQIVKEKINPLHRSRRSILQATLSFDFFVDALCNTRPDFSTFFTNHVAGMMHRYWRYSFPEDFGIVNSSSIERFRAKNILHAMDVASLQINTLMSIVSKQGGRLIVASSMGQEAIDRGPYIGEWRINHFKLFLRSIGWDDSIQIHLAMQPDFNFSFPSEAHAAHFVDLVSALTDASGQSIWKRIQHLSLIHI